MLVLSLSACGGGAATTAAEAPATEAEYSSLEDLVTAAQEEGELLLYTTLTEPDVEMLTKDFEEAYGITIKTLRLGSNDAITRFDSESEAKAPSADLMLVAETRYFADGVDRGYITPLTDTGVMDLLPDFPDEFLVPDASTAIVNVTNAGWVYNTQEVSEDELPESWEDLLDPRWEGKLVGPPASDEINNLITLSMVAEEHGEDYLSDLHGQLLREYPDLVPMHEAVASGEGHIGLQSIEFFVDALAAGGAPLGFVSVPPAYYPVHALGVASDAQHPAAARLLAHFLLSEDGGESVATGVGVYTPYDEEVPEDFSVPTIEEIDAIVENKAAIQNAYR
jgi:iron(III) transport system substrate-binding protein